MKILQASNLTKIYGAGDTEVHALDGVDLSVEKGEFVAVVGTVRFGKIHAAAHAGRTGPSDQRQGFGGRKGYFLAERRGS